METAYALAYPFTKRTADTELYLDDGQTMAIGGLIKKKTEEDLNKFPWLADVPVLGIFFRSKNTVEGKGFDTMDDSELFITLTPKIVSAPAGDKNKSEVGPKTLPSPEVDESSLSPTVKYAQLVQKRILDNLTYPITGKNAGFEGMVSLNLRISYKGELLEAKINKSSGYKVLDDDALRTAGSISSYPPFPPLITSEDLWIEVPVSYKLN